MIKITTKSQIALLFASDYVYSYPSLSDKESDPTRFALNKAVEYRIQTIYKHEADPNNYLFSLSFDDPVYGSTIDPLRKSGKEFIESERWWMKEDTELNVGWLLANEFKLVRPKEKGSWEIYGRDNFYVNFNVNTRELIPQYEEMLQPDPKNVERFVQLYEETTGQTLIFGEH